MLTLLSLLAGTLSSLSSSSRCWHRAADDQWVAGIGVRVVLGDWGVHHIDWEGGRNVHHGGLSQCCVRCIASQCINLSRCCVSGASQYRTTGASTPSSLDHRHCLCCNWHWDASNPPALLIYHICLFSTSEFSQQKSFIKSHIFPHMVNQRLVMEYIKSPQSFFSATADNYCRNSSWARSALCRETVLWFAFVSKFKYKSAWKFSPISDCLELSISTGGQMLENSVSHQIATDQCGQDN